MEETNSHKYEYDLKQEIPKSEYIEKLMSRKNIENNKPEEIILRCSVIFYKDNPEPNTFGSDTITYELYYYTKDGILNVSEVGSFGDRTLVARLQDRRGRGITLKEMLENIEEISNMTYKEFNEKIVRENEVE